MKFLVLLSVCLCLVQFVYSYKVGHPLLNHLETMSASNYAIQPQGCQDVCCNNFKTCCKAQGGDYKANLCLCCYDDKCGGSPCINDGIGECCRKVLNLPKSWVSVAWQIAKIEACVFAPKKFGC
ncbi:hypothetical protein BY458DRAFT_529975 [Sporodiniella umbellata]|nr:hypothetical protein BY458DRAFT_529975 [Sporodiniella umbellata]